MKVEYQDKMLSLPEAKVVMNSIITGQSFTRLGKMAQHGLKLELKAKIESVELALSIWEHLKNSPPIKADVFPLTYFEREFAFKEDLNSRDIRTATQLLELDGLIEYINGYLSITGKGNEILKSSVV